MIRMIQVDWNEDKLAKIYNMFVTRPIKHNLFVTDEEVIQSYITKVLRKIITLRFRSNRKI